MSILTEKENSIFYHQHFLRIRLILYGQLRLASVVLVLQVAYPDSKNLLD
ncbi:hypothetical protein IBX65_06160 [Candidatus Aerophobetes bacterium]|nr:hypothetical protein [Candidatus Aerophobetes bacterium]